MCSTACSPNGTAPQGYDFDITNSTRYDQSFVPGRDIFENISTIVDDMIGTYLTRGDSIEPLFTQYCNGTTVTCPGGLSQWGTVPLAEQGLSAEQILQSFYGSDINFVTGAPLSPNLGGSFPGVTLRLGDFSEDVRTVQTRLNRISTNFPNIPKIYPTDGVFSADTERAVRAFQRQFNLTEDGLVGRATWYRIAFIYNNVKRLSELNSEGLALSEISRQYPERLTEGMSGPGVQLLQYFLAIVGEFYDALPRWQAGQLDGVFGPQTREAVTAYQQLVGLPMTGAVDRETWYALLSTYQSVLLSQPEQEWLGQFVGLPETFLVKGMRGKAVRQAQQLINIIARGYAEVPAVAEDGIFGDATESSVPVCGLRHRQDQDRGDHQGHRPLPCGRVGRSAPRHLYPRSLHHACWLTLWESSGYLSSRSFPAKKPRNGHLLPHFVQKAAL